MPRLQPPSVGQRPAQAQEVMDAVYEKMRAEGYPKERAAKIAWGAVHRAGYDPDHLGDLISEAEGLVKRLKARDRFIDETYGPLSEEYEPAFIPRRSRIISGGRRALRTGRRLRRQLTVMRSRRTTRPRIPAKTRVQTKRFSIYADPARLPKPVDIAGYDNLNNVRLVNKADAPGYYPVKRLMEGQIVLPSHQWYDLARKVEGWPDVEFTDEDGDRVPDRIIRRGRRNSQTNLFIDRA